MKPFTDVDTAILDRVPAHAAGDHLLHRKISWTGAFWVASGVPALVLFSIGAIAATVGQPAWVVWIVSILMGFIQAFTYAEIAGLFPNKSGGASVYGAIAWVRYSKFIAPVSVWCNWFAWSPVLSIGSGLAAGYMLTSLFPADAVINTWQLTVLDIGFVGKGLVLRINATFVVGATILLGCFAVQHRGIAGFAKLQTVLGLAALFPLTLIGLVPLITGDIPSAHFLPLLPLAHDSAGAVIFGTWNMAGWTLMAGGMFIAAWSTYGFETAVCYTSEFRNPRKDVFKAIFYSGLLCLVAFTIVPLAFQGSLGLAGMLDKSIYDGSGVAKAMAHMIGGGMLVQNLIIIMLILALVLSIMTSMGGSSRTLYQASYDGWLPKYLGRVNQHGAPTNAMWTDLGFNLVLLMMSDYVMVLAMSNVGYIIFNFLNLQAGWIHRLDRGTRERPYKAKDFLIGAGAVLGFVNLAFMGMGADIWGAGTLRNGLIFAALIVPVFLYRHYVQDKGRFPASMAEDMELNGAKLAKKAGILPYVALAAGVVVVWYTHSIAVLP
ncbi:MAG: amino acid permease-associated region [Massilia sp.]|nr:amino acid permease-associated region [Massilia sp.]MDB5949275.1 amino acid permease-associated region [Massilia sp.]